MRKIILTIFLVSIAHNSKAAFTATTSGNVLQLTATGLTKVKEQGRVIAKAYAYSLVVQGNGWTQLPNMKFAVSVTNNPAIPQNTDYAVVDYDGVGMGAHPGALTPASADMFGNSDRRPPGSATSYNKYSRHLVTTSATDCSGASSNISYAGTCTGGVVSCVKEFEPQTANGPWYHPKCSCDGSCAPNSGGCPYTTASPCTPFGIGSDTHAEVVYCYCADASVDAESTPFPYDPDPRPSGEFQPSTFPAEANTNSNNALTAIGAALNFFRDNVHPDDYNSVNTPSGQSYKTITDGSIALQTPLILGASDYTIPPGSPASPSTGAVQNVFLGNSVVHVIVDNAADIGGGGSSGPVEIANGTLPTITAVEPYAGTSSLAAEWAAFKVDHPDPPPIFALAQNLTFPTIVVDPAWTPQWCLTFAAFGTHCLNFETFGFWTWIALFKFFVVGGAFVAAYYIIAG